MVKEYRGESDMLRNLYGMLLKTPLKYLSVMVDPVIHCKNIIKFKKKFAAPDVNYRPDPSMYKTLRIGLIVEATFSLYTPPINSDCSNITGISMDYAKIFKKVEINLQRNFIKKSSDMHKSKIAIFGGKVF